jgi:uncharacterized protein with PIN domain
MNGTRSILYQEYLICQYILCGDYTLTASISVKLISVLHQLKKEMISMSSEDYRCTECGEPLVPVSYPDDEIINQCPEGH